MEPVTCLVILQCMSVQVVMYVQVVLFVVMAWSHLEKLTLYVCPFRRVYETPPMLCMWICVSVCLSVCKISKKKKKKNHN